MAVLEDGLEFRQIIKADKEKLRDFECTHADTTEFFRNDVFAYLQENIGVTYGLFNSRKEMLALITIGMGAIKFPDNLAIEMQGAIEKPSQLPALKIGRLATNKKFERRGYAKKTMEITTKLAMELKRILGCRYVILDAYTDKIAFYQKLGFKSFYEDLTGRITSLMFLKLNQGSIPEESEI